MEGMEYRYIYTVLRAENFVNLTSRWANLVLSPMFYPGDFPREECGASLARALVNAETAGLCRLSLGCCKLEGLKTSRSIL